MKKLVTIIAALALVSSAASAQKFGHIDFQETVQLMNQMDEAMDKMAAAQQAASETYQELVQEFQNKMSQYEQKKATWASTPSILQSKERELEDLQNRIREFQETVQQELSEQQQTLMAPIVEAAQQAVNKVAAEKGLAFVFDKASVLYIDAAQSIDITAAVRTELGIPEDRTMESVAAARQAKYEAAQAQQEQ
ncbi:MAG: OmpH family outer membrane protein [Bacteroidales bacterium]|nr:OmpH family outer membrane protein [Bacteroidales bacterium]